jgi:hypothetical protein
MAPFPYVQILRSPGISAYFYQLTEPHQEGISGRWRTQGTPTTSELKMLPGLPKETYLTQDRRG